MGPSELLRVMVETLDRLQISYLVTGSMATIAYGEPRFTNDTDMVIPLTADTVDAFCAEFLPPEFYCSTSAAFSGKAQRRH